MDNAPPANVPASGKYSLSIEPVLTSVSSAEDMLGKIANLKFMDHDITDAKKISELAREQYLCTRSVPGIGEILKWASGLGKAGI
jgi:hypothetical protein